MTTPWQPFREPIRSTFSRTIAIAIVVGAIIARVSGGGIAAWPFATLLVLWPSFGGHWVDLFFLNWLRPRIPAAPSTQIAARFAVWFVGGALLGLGVIVTSTAITAHSPIRWTQWWLLGIGFIGVELIAHSALQFRGRPSFYNGRG